MQFTVNQTQAVMSKNKQDNAFASSLVSCTVLLPLRFPHLHPRQQGWTPGAAVISPGQFLSTAPFCSQSPCSGTGFLPWDAVLQENKDALAWLLHRLPPGALHLLQCGFLLPSRVFFHPLPVLSHFRFLWSNLLLCSIESNTALIWVYGSEM